MNAMTVVVVVVLVVLVCGGAARGQAEEGVWRWKPATCEDLASNDTYQLSYEGSWSYMIFEPQSTPTAMGALGYRVFSDWSPSKPLYPDIVSLGVEGNTCAVEHDGGYVWRPDVAITKARCGEHVHVTTSVTYLTDTLVCAQYNLRNEHDRKTPAQLYFTGATPNFLGASSTASINGTGIFVSTDATMLLPPYTQQMRRYFEVQTSLETTPSLTGDGRAYSWSLTLPGAHATNITFCLQEYETEPSAEGGPAATSSVLDHSNTTANINGWLAQLPPPPASAHMGRSEFRLYYNAWFQFWFNTERAGGKHWVRPVITPSMSRYGRGMWLWDTGFHVFALLTSPGKRALEKAKDQITVLTTAGKAVGHIPRVVGADTTENTTQPPGILTWAALVIFNRTHDQLFLQLAYHSFAQNNDWFYATRASKDHTDLCLWKGEDSGWDTSPRWDKGIVEAIDLNTWLHMDHLLLAHMAGLLGNSTAQHMWQTRANRSAAAVQRWLWDDDAGLFWDRLPGSTHPTPSFTAARAVAVPAATATNTSTTAKTATAGTRVAAGMSKAAKPGAFVQVITPAPFWALLGNIASTAQAAQISKTLLTSDNLMTPYHMPCVGRSEKVFNPRNYWRGPVWVNVNWLAGVGMECYGDTQRAAMLRNGTVTVVSGQPEPREYYDPLTGDGLGAHNFMWTGAVYITTLQEMAGNRDVARTLHNVLQCSA